MYVIYKQLIVEEEVTFLDTVLEKLWTLPLEVCAD